jgi:hypothetical protein
MNININIRLLKYFSGGMFANGFYRSWISRPIRDYDDSHDDEIFLDKILRASLNGILHTTWYCPVSIYQSLGRLEVKLTRKDPNNHKYLYTEPFMYTTLPKPSQKITVVPTSNK